MASRLGWFGRRSLFGKYVLTFVALVISILALSGATEMWFTYRDRKAELLRTQMEKADDAAQRVEQFIADIERQISWATRASAITLDQRRADYELILQHTPAIAQISQLDADGKEVLLVSRVGIINGSGDDHSGVPAFRRATPNAAWFGPVTFTDRGPRMQISMAHAGQDAGVTVADIELKFLSDILNGIQAAAGMYAYIANGSGRSDRPRRFRRCCIRNPNLSHLPQIEALAAAPEGSVSVGRRLSTANPCSPPPPLSRACNGGFSSSSRLLTLMPRHRSA